MEAFCSTPRFPLKLKVCTIVLQAGLSVKSWKQREQRDGLRNLQLRAVKIQSTFVRTMGRSSLLVPVSRPYLTPSTAKNWVWLFTEGFCAVNVMAVVIVAIFSRARVIEPSGIGLIPLDRAADAFFKTDQGRPA